MTRIGILSNAHSQRNQSALPAIERMLAEFPEAAHQSFHHINEMPQAVATLARSGVDHLVINGGDGTDAGGARRAAGALSVQRRDRASP